MPRIEQEASEDERRPSEAGGHLQRREDEAQQMISQQINMSAAHGGVQDR